MLGGSSEAVLAPGLSAFGGVDRPSLRPTSPSKPRNVSDIERAGVAVLSMRT